MIKKPSVGLKHYILLLLLIDEGIQHLVSFNGSYKETPTLNKLINNEESIESIFIIIFQFTVTI